MTDTLRPRLVLFQGDRILAVREVPPDHEWVLGRRPDSPLPLNERSISRQHARAYCDSAGTHLEDLGTPNGTWVDGAPLRGTVVLRDGQVIRLGQSTNPDPLLLRFEDPASRLLDTLADGGRRVIGPMVADGAIVLDEIRSASDLPVGWVLKDPTLVEMARTIPRDAADQVKNNRAHDRQATEQKQWREKAHAARAD